MPETVASEGAVAATDALEQHVSIGSTDDRVRIYKMLVSGGIAGAVSRTLTAPIDRLKMLLQVQDDARGMSLRDGIRFMRAEGSVRAFFKGNGANVIKIAPETALKLTMNDRFKKVIASNPDAIQPFERMVAGGLAGAAAQFALYPLDTIRTRLATAPNGTYRGISHAAYVMCSTEGVRSLYSGLLPSMIGILPYAGVDIMMFEMAREYLMEEYNGNPPHIAILLAGMVSSSVAQVVSYPLSLIRTRLQAQSYSEEATLKYSGMWDVVQKSMAREGWRGLYKGIVPNMIKLAPAAGISWYVFEETKNFLRVDEPHFAEGPQS